MWRHCNYKKIDVIVESLNQRYKYVQSLIKNTFGEDGQKNIERTLKYLSNKEYSRSSCKWHSTCKWWQNSSISIKNWKKIELVISNDGRIRGAIVLTKTNEAEHLIRRPINRLYRSNSLEVFLGKGVLKICSKFTGEHPCRSVISIKLLCNFAAYF